MGVKEYQREYQKSYYRKNKERILRYHKEWYEKNRELYNSKRNKDSTNPHYQNKVLYSVWNNFTDDVIIIDGTARECAAVMGIKECSFYSLVTRCMQGKCHKWTFKKRKIKSAEGKKCHIV